jgi:hypothetical protein
MAPAGTRMLAVVAWIAEQERISERPKAGLQTDDEDRHGASSFDPEQRRTELASPPRNGFTILLRKQ